MIWSVVRRGRGNSLYAVNHAGLAGPVRDKQRPVEGPTYKRPCREATATACARLPTPSLLKTEARW